MTAPHVAYTVMREGMARVTWVDSWSVHGWKFPSEIDPQTYAEIETVGFVLRQDEGGIQLIGSRHTDGKGSVSQHIAIPRQSIVRIEYLVTE